MATMFNKNSFLALIFFIIITADSLAIGITSLKTTQFFISDTASAENIVFSTGFTILLDPIYIIVAPLLSYWSDFMGRKLVLAVCYAFAFFSFLLSLFGQEVNSLGLALIACFLYGIASSCLPVVMAAICDISKKTQRVRYFAAIVSSLSFVVVGNYLGAMLDFHLSNHIYLSLKLAVLLEGFNLLLVLAFVPKLFKQRRYGTKQMRFHGLTQNLVRVVMVKGIRLHLFWLICFCLAWGLYSQVIFVLLTKFHHFTDLQTSNFQLYNFGLFACTFFVVLTPVGRWIADNPAKMMQTSALLATCLLLFTCIYHMNLISFGIIAIPLNLCFGIIMVSIWYGLSQASAQRHYGIVMGLQGASWAFAWALSSIISSVFKSFGSSTYVNTQLYFSVIIIIMIVMLLTIKRRRFALSP